VYEGTSRICGTYKIHLIRLCLVGCLSNLLFNSLLSFGESKSSVDLVFLSASSLDDSLSLVSVLDFSLGLLLLGWGFRVLSDFFVNLGVELFQ